jgi:hypothetical protein
MSNSLRRFEFLLPRQFNDGKAVPYELIGETILELRRRFGAASSETQIIQGYWEHEEQAYRDELVRIFVDVPDTPENRQFFKDFKELLKKRFQQLEIWMTTYPIERI